MISFMRNRFLIQNFSIMIFMFVVSMGVHAEEGIPSVSDKVENRWSFLGGYGITHCGLGKTKVQVQSVDFIPRYERFLAKTMGSSWYQGRHSLMIETPLTLVVDPDVAPMVGINFLAGWTFTGLNRIIPYAFAGGGPLYTSADIPGLGSELNGNYQAGIGIRFKTNKNYQFNIEYRFQHISNGGTKTPNDPLNSSRFLLGITF